MLSLYETKREMWIRSSSCVRCPIKILIHRAGERDFLCTCSCVYPRVTFSRRDWAKVLNMEGPTCCASELWAPSLKSCQGQNLAVWQRGRPTDWQSPVGRGEIAAFEIERQRKRKSERNLTLRFSNTSFGHISHCIVMFTARLHCFTLL